MFNSQPRRWLHVDKKGNLEYRTIDRQDLVHELNISYRDVRILDPLVATPYPTALLIREKALVVNIEAVRMIICKDQCFVLSVPNPNVPGTVGMFPVEDCDFVQELVGLITQRSQHHTYSHAASELDAKLPWELRALEAALQATGRMLGDETSAMEARAIPALSRLMQKLTDEELEKMRATKAALSALIQRVAKVRQELEETLDDDQDMLDMYLGRRAQQNEAAANRAAAAARTSGQQGGGGGGAKPACSARDSPEATSIGDPAAEELAAERHAPQEGRATGDVNHGKAAAQHRGATVAGATEAGGGGGDAEVADGVASAAAGARRNSSPVQHLRSSLQEERQAANDDNPRALHPSPSAPEHMNLLLARLQAMQRDGNGSMEGLTLEDVATAGLYAMAHSGGGGAPRGHSPPDPRDISECEGLLEVYFKQSDDLLRRLVATRSRIADTEAAIEVLLDQRRNGLVALTLVVNSMMLAFGAVAMVVGAFGMNFATWMSEQSAEVSKRNFQLAFLISSALAFLMFLGIMLYARSRKLLWIPEAGLT